jgi:hypothetical protein
LCGVEIFNDVKGGVRVREIFNDVNRDTTGLSYCRVRTNKFILFNVKKKYKLNLKSNLT